MKSIKGHCSLYLIVYITKNVHYSECYSVLGSVNKN